MYFVVLLWRRENIIISKKHHKTYIGIIILILISDLYRKCTEQQIRPTNTKNWGKQVVCV